MANIIYGIQSDGLGHYSRSKLVIDHLMNKGHRVKVLTSDRVYEFMKDDYDTEKIARISFFYRNNRVNYTRTIYENFVKFPDAVKNGLRKTKKIFDAFKPDLVITDMEIFSTRIAARRNIPVITIDNIHTLSRTNAPKDVKKKYKFLEAEQKSFLKILSPRSKVIKHYFITSFFRPSVTHGKTSIIPSLIRDEIIRSKGTKNSDHILVYQTSKTNKDLFPALKEVNKEKFVVYGFDEEKEEGNLTFKRTNIADSFLNDLASAKAVITNGGFSLMSEAVFLHKPVLSNPVAGQFEQIINATMLEKGGYGMFADKINADNIKLFLRNLDKYNQKLDNFTQEDNSEAFSKIDSKIEEVLNTA